MDGEEQLFDPKHPIYKIITLLVIGLLLLGGVNITDLAMGVLGG